MKKFALGSLTALLIVTLSACCGCGRQKNASAVPLTGTEWKLVELDGKRITPPTDRPEAYTLTLDTAETRVYGMGACNRFFGNYTLSDTHRIKFGALGSTRMACPGMEVENQYFRMFDRADSYTIDSDMLMLQNNGNVIAIFQEAKK